MPVSEKKRQDFMEKQRIRLPALFPISVKSYKTHCTEGEKFCFLLKSRYKAGIKTCVELRRLLLHAWTDDGKSVKWEAV